MKKMKKALAAVLTGTVVCGMLTMGASAAGVAKLADGQTGLLDVTKILTVDNENTVPTEEFTFSIKGEKGTANEQNGYTVYEGPALDDNKITMSFAKDGAGKVEDSAIEAGKKDVTQVESFDFSNVKFDAPGAYRYVVTEEAGSTAGMNYDGNSYVVYVYVGYDDNDELQVENIQSHAAGNASKAPIEFKNSFITEDLEISKTVAGNAGERDRAFSFTALVDECAVFPKGTELTGTITTNGAQAGTPVTLTVGEEYSFELKHNQTLKIDGLAIGAKVTVKEADVAGYTTTIAASDPTADTKTNGQAVVTINDGGQNTVDYTNTKTTTATGVALNVAPYIVALFMALAAGVAFFFKKKRS